MEDDLRQEAEERLGSQVGPFRLVTLLGVGGMGGVYAADDGVGNRVAIKVLHKSVASLNNVRARFEDELRLASRIRHPGVVQIHGGGVSEAGDAYLVMELLEGQNLDAVVESRGGTLPAEEVLAVAAHTLTALGAAHAAGVVHRDLKPENLFLTRTGALKVLDFGVARLTSEREQSAKRTRTGVLMGTPAFMAPEQARGRWSEVDERTDLWAVGAIMFSALAGRPVHLGETLHELLVTASLRPAPSLARVMQAPMSLVRVVDKALAFDKHERYQSAAEMLAAVSAAVPDVLAARTRGEAVVAKRPVTAAPPAEASRALTPEERAARDGYELVKATDAERATLSAFFAMLERGMVISTQYGPDHPEARKRMGAAIDDALGAMAASRKPIAWNVTPYGFTAGGQAVWEPAAPLDRIPYHLFMDGVRTLALLPGLTPDEFRRFLHTITLDRARDMAPEDDLVTQLFEAGFEHVVHQAIDTFAEGDQDRRGTFEDQASSVESLARFSLPGSAGAVVAEDARVHEARIVPLLHGQDRPDVESLVQAEEMLARRSAPAVVEDALALGDAEARALQARLRHESDQVRPRFVAAVALAWNEATLAGATAGLALPLANAVDSLAARVPDLAASTTASMCDAAGMASAEQARAMAVAILRPDTLARILEGGTSAATLARLLGHLDEGHLGAVLARLPGTQDEALAGAMHDYLVRVGRGREPLVGEILGTAEVDVGLALIRVLSRIGTEAARQAILRGASSRHAVVRIEALAHMEGASSERLRLELKAFLEDEEPAVRLAALRTIGKHRVRAAGPSLVLRIKSPRFDALPEGERALALETLATLAPSRAETVCVELLDEGGGLLATDAHEQTRVLAVGLLARIGRSQESREALARASQSRWGASAKVREAAEAAQQRLSVAPRAPGRGRP